MEASRPPESGLMQLRHIIAAADESAEGRAAILAAALLAERTQARVTVISVAERLLGESVAPRMLDGLRATVTTLLRSFTDPPRVDLATAVGIPGIEIGRFAETAAADLVVLGRKRRSDMQRLLLGDTADSVARRSRTPCLFVQSGEFRFGRVLLALDGSERGMSIMLPAIDFARGIAARIRAVTVEPIYENESPALEVPTGRSARLIQAVDEVRNASSLGRGSWEMAQLPTGDSPVAVHRGHVVDEIVREIERSGSDILVLGYHRGGPAGVLEAGSVSRRLAHEAPCSVLTIPL